MVQSMVADPGGSRTLPLPFLHQHRDPPGSSTETTGRGADTLRHSIVEMAGKAGQPPGVGRASAQVIPLGRLDSSRHIRQHLAEIDAGYNAKPRITLITKSRDKINLDLGKIQRDPHQQTSLQRVYQQSLHTQTANIPDPKERASAWLLRRFKERHVKGATQRQDVVKGERRCEVAKENHEPTKRPSVAPGSGKTRRIGSNRVLENQKEQHTVPSLPHQHIYIPRNEERGLDSIAPLAVENEAPSQQKPTAREMIEIYEVRGTAIQTTPKQEKQAGRSGLFSASLEAFKRRLRLSASRKTQRLHGDELEGIDSYLITADHKDSRRVSRDYIDDMRNSTTLPKPPVEKTGFQRKSAPLKRTTPNPVFPGDSGQDDFKARAKREPRPVSKTFHHQQNETSRPRPLSGSSGDKKHDISPSKRSLSPESPRFSYKLPPTKCENKEVSFGESSKVHVPNVKTYVLQSNLPPQTKDKTCQPVPLTMHNLKLHDSLISIYERRRKRQARHQRNFQHSNSSFNVSNSSRSSDESGPSERMWQWLREAAELTTVPPGGDGSEGDCPELWEDTASSPREPIFV